MDISVMIDKYKFNYRVAAVIRKDNKILLHHGINKDHATLPGGRVSEGEDSIAALQREIEEEIGFKTDFVKSIALVENLFEMNNNYHELLMVHELKFKDEETYKKDLIQAIEPHKIGKLEFIWQDVDKLEEVNFVPKKLMNIIRENKGFTHIINDER